MINQAFSPFLLQLSIDDLNGFNIIGLKDFLRARGVCTSASGATPISTSASAATATSSIFDDNSFGWKQIESGDIISIPKQFTIEEITSYLTTLQVSLVIPVVQNQTGSGSDDDDSNVAADSQRKADV